MVRRKAARTTMAGSGAQDGGTRVEREREGTRARARTSGAGLVAQVQFDAVRVGDERHRRTATFAAPRGPATFAAPRGLLAATTARRLADRRGGRLLGRLGRAGSARPPSSMPSVGGGGRRRRGGLPYSRPISGGRCVGLFLCGKLLQVAHLLAARHALRRLPLERAPPTEPVARGGGDERRVAAIGVLRDGASVPIA